MPRTRRSGTAGVPRCWGKLYQNTRRELQEGLDALRERAAACRESPFANFAHHGIDDDRATALWDDPDDDFFVHHSPAQVVTITRAIDGHNIDAGPLVTVLEVADEASAEGATEVFLYGRDRDGLFADSVRAIDSANLRVAAARIATSASGICFNSYIVLGIDGTPVADDKRAALAEALTRAMRGDSDAKALRHVSRQLKQFVMPTEVALATDPGARTSNPTSRCFGSPGPADHPGRPLRGTRHQCPPCPHHDTRRGGSRTCSRSPTAPSTQSPTVA